MDAAARAVRVLFGVMALMSLLVLGGCVGRALDQQGAQGGQDTAAVGPAATAEATHDLGADGLRDGVWLTFVGSPVFSSPESLAAALTQIRNAGFDTVYPVVWNKGFTTFPSPSLERFGIPAIDPSFAGRDPLKEIIDANRRLGLRLAVIPWFEYGLKVVFGPASGPGMQPSADAARRYPLAHKAREQGLLLKRSDGSDSWYDKVSRHSFGFLNPADPRVAELLGGIIGDLSDRYAIDGLQIDDHFSVHKEFGYNDDVMRGFEARLAAKGHERLFLRAQGLTTRDSEIRDGLWRDYRSDLVAELAVKLKDRLPRRLGFIYQISPAGDISFSLLTWLQDWRALVHDKHVQEFVIQAYRDRLDTFVRLIDHESVKVSRSRAIAQAGLFAGYKGEVIRETSLLVSQIKAARARNMGVSIFFYDTLFTGEPGRAETIRQALSSRN